MSEGHRGRSRGQRRCLPPSAYIPLAVSTLPPLPVPVGRPSCARELPPHVKDSADHSEHEDADADDQPRGLEALAEWFCAWYVHAVRFRALCSTAPAPGSHAPPRCRTHYNIKRKAQGQDMCRRTTSHPRLPRFLPLAAVGSAILSPQGGGGNALRPALTKAVSRSYHMAV